MRPVIPWCDVKMYGALFPEGEELTKCRLSMNGDPADVILYARNIEGQRWSPVDRLTQAKITENNGSLTIEGTSQELVDIVGMAPTDAQVRWEVTPKGCANCG